MCAMNPRLLRPLATGFSPRSIAGLAGWWDATAASSLFDAVTGGSPTAADGSVMRWEDRSGSGNHLTQPANDTADAPVRKVADVNTAGKDAVLFDGTNDVLTLANNVNTSSGGSLFIVHKRTADANGGIHAFSGVADANHHPFSGTFYDGFASGTRRSWSQAYSDDLQIYSVVSGASWVAYVDASAVNTVSGVTPAAQAAGRPQGFGSGRYLNNTAQDFHAGGYVCEAMVYNRALTTAERQKIEGWLAWRWGLQAQLPSNHPYAYSFPGFGSQARPDNGDALAWESEVYANSGSVSVGTLAAVNTFANAIDAASLRDRFYRLNLFAGTGLNACLVPLYRGPSRTGTQYGNSTDTNVGTFASADYQETGSGGGLKGDGTNNYLNTGVLLPTLSSVDFHVSGYVTVTTVNSFRSITGASGTNGFLFGSSGPTTTRAFFFGGGTNSLGATTHPTGLHLFTQTGNKTGGIYFDGALDTSSYANANNTDGDFSAGFGSIREIPVFVENRNTNIVGYYDGRLAGYSLGAGMTAAQVEDYYDILQAFQAALGRDV